MDAGKPQKAPRMYIKFKVDEDFHKALLMAAEARNLSLSEFIRRACLSQMDHVPLRKRLEAGAIAKMATSELTMSPESAQAQRTEHNDYPGGLASFEAFDMEGGLTDV